MIQKTFTTSPSNAMNKIAELRADGWTIIANGNTSTPSTEPDARGVSYGGPEFSILAEREHAKPRHLSRSEFEKSICGEPINPPSIFGR